MLAAEERGVGREFYFAIPEEQGFLNGEEILSASKDILRLVAFTLGYLFLPDVLKFLVTVKS